MSALFTLTTGSTTTDYTTKIQNGSWKVNNVDVQGSWTDSLLNTHPYVLRKQIKGTFTMLFLDILEAKAFINAINTNKDVTTGLLPGVGLWAYNEQTFYSNKTMIFSYGEPADTDPNGFVQLQIQIQEV